MHINSRADMKHTKFGIDAIVYISFDLDVLSDSMFSIVGQSGDAATSLLSFSAWCFSVCSRMHVSQVPADNSHDGVSAPLLLCLS